MEQHTPKYPPQKRSENWEKYLTEQGKSKWEFFQKHKLGQFYDPMMGNLQIDNEDWPTVKESVLQFIAEYWEDRWYLSCIKDMWFVSQMED